MTRRPLGFAASFAAAGVALASAQAPDLSGTWNLDRDASRITTAEGLAGLGDEGAPEILHITQAANGNLILSSRVNAAQPRVYQVEGESSLPAPGEDGGTMTVTSRWDDGSLVNEGSVAIDGGGTIRVYEELALSPDGRTLVLEVTTATSGGEETNRLVYRKAG